MVEDGTYTAVLDRFEVTQDDVERGVLLVESDGEVVGELTAEREWIPADGQHPDAVFVVTVTNGELQSMDYQPEETERRGESAQSRFDRLSDRPPETENGPNQ